MAFAMALHPRLGSRALGRHLDDNMLRLICKTETLNGPNLNSTAYEMAHDDWVFVISFTSPLA